MILGVGWLKKYSPIHMDFIKMEMKVSALNGQLVTFVDETVPLTPPTEARDNTDKLMKQAVCGKNFCLLHVVWIWWLQLKKYLQNCNHSCKVMSSFFKNLLN